MPKVISKEQYTSSPRSLGLFECFVQRGKILCLNFKNVKNEIQEITIVPRRIKTMSITPEQFREEIEKGSRLFESILKEIGRVVVGQKEMLEFLLMGLLTDGHVLLEGVPGLAKTLSVSSLAKATSLHFQRLQFTPDLLPSDLVGTMIFNPKSGEFTPKKGPVFANIVLADEINRSPAKVQSALLEAMAEKQVTIGDTTYPLERPFLVLATQNPIEQEGTYPLPEAQMDRFMFKVVVSYPNKNEELQILETMSQDQAPSVKQALDSQNLLRCMQLVKAIHMDSKIKDHIVEIVLATRQPKSYGLSNISHLLQLGASPRATIALAKGARAHAFIRGRSYVTVDDVKAIVYPVLRHRLILSYEAEAEGISSDDVIQQILKQIEVPRVESTL